MPLLAIETATDACSVALSVEGEIFERHRCVPREHAARVLGMIDELLIEAGIASSDIVSIAFGRGPGSFLGTRIAATVAQGLALSWGCKLVSVSSLAALATVAYKKHGLERVLSAWDARMQGIYWGDYEYVDGLMVARLGDRLSSPESFSEYVVEGSIGLIGNAWKTYASELPADWTPHFECVDTDSHPRASGLLPLAEQSLLAGDTLDLASAVPVYLRHPVKG